MSQPQIVSREFLVRALGFQRLALREGRRAVSIRESGPAGPEGSLVTYFERPDTVVLVMQRLAENAEDVDALFVLAAIQAREGQVSEGLTILDHVLRLDPTYPGAWMFKAVLHRMIGEREAERSARERAEDAER